MHATQRQLDWECLQLIRSIHESGCSVFANGCNICTYHVRYVSGEASPVLWLNGKQIAQGLAKIVKALPEQAESE